MLDEQIQKIIELRHPAPYEVLGPHYAGRTLTIRAFLPQAERAYVLPTDGTVKREMQRLHPEGLFALELPGIKTLDYRLVVTDANGQAVTLHDPYAIHHPAFTAADGAALAQGTLDPLFRKLGARPRIEQGVAGVNFAVWAPHASRVSVVGTFNQWDGRRHLLAQQPGGVWEIFVPEVELGELYKYEIRNAEGAVFLKPDPMAFQTEIYPSTAAVICDLRRYPGWNDSAWLSKRQQTPGWNGPVAVHRVTFSEDASDGLDQVANYHQLTERVLPAVIERQQTHVELCFWHEAETVASYFAPNPRFGRPTDLMAFIDTCHQHDIGVILDWIPPLLPREGQELSWFDGTRIYDTDVPDQPGQLAFDLQRPETRNFVLANAQFW